MPLAAIVGGRIFCVHGGLSPDLQSMNDIMCIQRPTHISDYGPLRDLLWSNPSKTTREWEENKRGVSFCFGKTIVDEFLARHNMDMICRAGSLVGTGYKFWYNQALVSIFRAPSRLDDECHGNFYILVPNERYHPDYGNRGACMRADFVAPRRKPSC
jgi:serine/threonine-protein phosphatase PP1 catalytic subunit